MVQAAKCIKNFITGKPVKMRDRIGYIFTFFSVKINLKIILNFSLKSQILILLPKIIPWN